MAGRVIPETSNRADWARLVAQSHKDHEGRLKLLEGGTGGISRAKGRFVYG